MISSRISVGNVVKIW
uniref:Uncharacterized protein n=1 Tax=Arundo donax TaxID=35708 RepID=A0A0A8ZPJ9_ARUDO